MTGFITKCRYGHSVYTVLNYKSLVKHQRINLNPHHHLIHNLLHKWYVQKAITYFILEAKIEKSPSYFFKTSNFQLSIETFKTNFCQFCCRSNTPLRLTFCRKIFFMKSFAFKNLKFIVLSSAVKLLWVALWLALKCIFLTKIHF